MEGQRQSVSADAQLARLTRVGTSSKTTMTAQMPVLYKLEVMPTDTHQSVEKKLTNGVAAKRYDDKGVGG